MSIQEDEKHYRFTIDILKALHLETKHFFSGVADKEPYEFQIYCWINNLYEKRKSTDDAINEIHRIRRLFLLQSSITP